MVRRIAVALLVSMLAFVHAARAQAPTGAAKDGKDAPAKPVIPVFAIDGPLTESPAPDELPLFGPPPKSLKVVLERMAKAAQDPNVKAVVVLSERPGVGLAQVEELRKAVDKLRAAGKEVYSHGDSVTMGEYLLLCSATRLSVTPTADLWLAGIRAETPYLRGLLDKLGVEPDFMTNGEYKSAAEMFMRTGPSKEADEMTNWLLDSIYNSWVNQIAAGRKMPAEQVKPKIDVGLYSAERAKEAGLIDAVEHRQDFEAMLRQKFGADVTFDRNYGKPAEPQLDMSSPMAVFKIWGELLSGGPKKRKPAGPSVGVVYVEGMIVPGASEPSLFGGTMAASSDIRRALDKAAEDDTIKAVVLRINSPGGSATASEIILDATKRLKARKPFVVSMGDVAGSGGYYVACGADTIFADETTITGSIGVVAGKLVTDPMWNKVGITFKAYQRGKNADLLSSSTKFTDEQRAHLKGWMTEVYDVFKGHVQAARGNRLKKPLEELAGGRVYTGRQALELGLVDQIGTMDDAVRFVAEQANLDTYDVRVVPEPKNFLEVLMAGMSGQTSEEDGKHVLSGGARRAAAPIPGAGSLAELALPHLRQLDPARVRSVLAALQRLDLMREESVILTMPEVTIGQ